MSESNVRSMELDYSTPDGCIRAASSRVAEYQSEGRATRVLIVIDSDGLAPTLFRSAMGFEAIAVIAARVDLAVRDTAEHVYRDRYEVVEEDCEQ